MSQAATAICQRFDQQAARYEREAALQRAVAWRLAHYAAALPLPAGPCADLGAGSGLFGQALQQLAPQLQLRQVDGSAALLARNPLASQGERGLLWNLETGLPQELKGCALLNSSFSLHWLRDPAERLQQWAASLQPGGWLQLAVPVAGSFPQWQLAAQRAGVPCTARPLPEAGDLVEAAASQLQLRVQRRLVFSRRYGAGGQAFLRQLRRLGAGHSDQPPLSCGQWRRLLHHWPVDEHVSWHLLLLVGQR
ncbi:MAG: methyltransferase [Cyanobacteriota bacterium]|nr:methyltransferase [Cyanobacteriota bacterium]